MFGALEGLEPDLKEVERYQPVVVLYRCRDEREADDLD
jgi:hypothetical protein